MNGSKSRSETSPSTFSKSGRSPTRSVDERLSNVTERFIQFNSSLETELQVILFFHLDLTLFTEEESAERED